MVYNWRQVSSKTIRKLIQDLVIQLSIWEPSGSLLLAISVKAPSAVMHSSCIIQYGPPCCLRTEGQNHSMFISVPRSKVSGSGCVFIQEDRQRQRTGAQPQPKNAKGESCHKPPPAPSNSPSLEVRSTRRASRPSSRGPPNPLRTLERLASNGGTTHQHK